MLKHSIVYYKINIRTNFKENYASHSADFKDSFEVMVPLESFVGL